MEKIEQLSGLMKTLKEGEIRRIVFPKIKPNKCGDIRGGFVDYRPEDAKCGNEAKYYMGRKMQENGMFRNFQCLCEGCMKSNVVDKEE